jgi:hypothetical protein
VLNRKLLKGTHSEWRAMIFSRIMFIMFDHFSKTVTGALLSSKVGLLDHAQNSVKSSLRKHSDLCMQWNE